MRPTILCSKCQLPYAPRVNPMKRVTYEGARSVHRCYGCGKVLVRGFYLRDTPVFHSHNCLIRYLALIKWTETCKRKAENVDKYFKIEEKSSSEYEILFDSLVKNKEVGGGID